MVVSSSLATVAKSPSLRVTSWVSADPFAPSLSGLSPTRKPPTFSPASMPVSRTARSAPSSANNFLSKTPPRLISTSWPPAPTAKSRSSHNFFHPIRGARYIVPSSIDATSRFEARKREPRSAIPNATTASPFPPTRHPKLTTPNSHEISPLKPLQPPPLQSESRSTLSPAQTAIPQTPSTPPPPHSLRPKMRRPPAISAISANISPSLPQKQMQAKTFPLSPATRLSTPRSRILQKSPQ